MRACLVLFPVRIMACLTLLEYILPGLDIGGQHRTCRDKCHAKGDNDDSASYDYAHGSELSLKLAHFGSGTDIKQATGCCNTRQSRTPSPPCATTSQNVDQERVLPCPQGLPGLPNRQT